MASGTSGSAASPEAPRGDHVVVCGMGRVGQGIVALLSRLREKVTVVTLSAPEPGSDGGVAGSVPLLLGDARDERLLAQARVSTAKALIVATDDDLANVTIALRARRMNPDLPVVVRLFDQDLAVHLEAALGIRRGYSASQLAAPAFVAAALGDTVRLAFEAGGESWIVEETRVEPDSPWAGRAVGQCAPSGRVVVACRHGDDWVIAPRPSETISAGDQLVVLGRSERRLPRQGMSGRAAALYHGLSTWWHETPRGLRFALYALLGVVAASVGLFHVVLGLPIIDAYYFVITTLTTTGYGDINLQSAPPLVKLYGTLVMVTGGALFAVVFSMVTDLLLRTRFGDLLARGAARQRDHVIVAGLGHTGFRVLRELVRMGEPTVAIECREDAPFVAAARTLSPVVMGNAGASETLRRAGLGGARTVVAVTSDDLTNTSIALAAKRARADCRAVARIFDSTLAAQMQRQLGIDVVISLDDAAAPTFVGAALDPDLVRGFVLDRWLLLIVHRVIGASSDPGAEARGECPLLHRPRRAREFVPRAADRKPEAGDEVILVRWIELSG
jgi:Trk K+ transport system NAD-binding subunit